MDIPTNLDTPINTLQQLMAITAEECGELTQVCMKIMRKHTDIHEVDESKWKDKLIEEAGDVLCMLELLSEHGVVHWQDIEDRVLVKREKLKQWSSLIE